MGSGNYGSSRINGGYGSSCVALITGNLYGDRFLRETSIILRERDKIISARPFFKKSGGLSLLWLRPWDGKTQINMDELDPLYIDVSRKIRLVEKDKNILARWSGTKAARLNSKDLKGFTGDPWGPVLEKNVSIQLMTVASSGLNYRLISDVMLGQNYKRSLLQERYELMRETSFFYRSSCTWAR